MKSKYDEREISAIERYQNLFCRTCSKKTCCSQNGLEIVICALSRLNKSLQEVQHGD